ncbi:hypothetical protein [Blastopirellula marina]|uniref:Uncharacterized protein n=1 Tax=Blastopirellula marina TaxID=124 RepID=A0A2S8GHT9_9BACT|nr:hypothetical protein [Blastopirellula marina]PQO44028.1 hypothetical protein C5Y93_21030 [Blastopirellula marina]
MKTYRVEISSATLVCVERFLDYVAVTQNAPLNAERWWTERGSGRCLYDELSLERAVIYLRDAQDRK